MGAEQDVHNVKINLNFVDYSLLNRVLPILANIVQTTRKVFGP